ncbi:HdeA family protein [Massilia sp. PAMC28688]|uniref:HdeA family protein n=1 Tax=Massilia sp. PAMC28688 TaxID=2861283 RepID=UPI001C628A9E|nr:HdeA family protein [Massilia sp. PAMC28688]QYF92359.1 HdeA family protein [Massilia sp. PAMC28688]
MKSLLRITLLASAATVSSLSMAHEANMQSKKPIVKTTCQDYLAMDEVLKPKFIYYVVGNAKRGKPEAVYFDVDYVERIVPAIEKYCRVHLTASAYQRVIAESIASEPDNLGAEIAKPK